MSPGAVLAFDIGGTRIKSAVVVDGRVVGLRRDPTPATYAATLECLPELGTEQRATQPAVTHVAACVPGIVNADGRIASLPGKLPGAEGQNLRTALEDAFHLPASVCNDALAYGSGEAVAGAGRGQRRVVVVTIGTGVGVTVCEDGVPLGEGPFGGGILGGQIPILAEGGGLRDTSGRSGTIEAVCRAERLVDYTREAGGAAFSPTEVMSALAEGDPAAGAGVARYRALLAQALVALAHAHGPDVIVVGGGPAGPGSAILEGIEEVMTPRLFGNYRVRVRLAEGGDGAALLGLAHLALTT
ncbi:MAG: ROK family protein [Candidatus Dormibacteria bacterium]